jgi:hypothetical protein
MEYSLLKPENKVIYVTFIQFYDLFAPLDDESYSFMLVFE